MIKKIFKNYPEIEFVRELDGKGGYKNIFVQYIGEASIAERGEKLMKLEEELIKDINPDIRIWHEPLGDKNTLRKMRGVSL